jgi:DNA-binding Xre family transcriptional regulator
MPAKTTKVARIMFEEDISNEDVYNSIKDIVDAAPVSRCIISNLKNGKQEDALVSTILKMCIGLGVTPNDLIQNPFAEDEQWGETYFVPNPENNISRSRIDQKDEDKE